MKIFFDDPLGELEKEFQFSTGSLYLYFGDDFEKDLKIHFNTMLFDVLGKISVAQTENLKILLYVPKTFLFECKSLQNFILTAFKTNEMILLNPSNSKILKGFVVPIFKETYYQDLFKFDIIKKCIYLHSLIDNFKKDQELDIETNNPFKIWQIQNEKLLANKAKKSTEVVSIDPIANKIVEFFEALNASSSFTNFLYTSNYIEFGNGLLMSKFYIDFLLKTKTVDELGFKLKLKSRSENEINLLLNEISPLSPIHNKRKN